MPNQQLETTIHNKTVFLEQYPTFTSVTGTAKAIGINKHTVYRWLRLDKHFITAFARLKKEVQLHTIELHEKNIYDIALDEKTPPQSRIFGSLCILRANDPDKWREKANAIPISGELKVILSVPPYSDDVTHGKLLVEGKQDGQHSEREDEALP